MILKYLLLIMVIPRLEGTSKSRLSKRPAPQPNFILERYLGDWYVQGYSGICSWPGAHKFSDFISRYELRQGNRPALIHTWRHIECTTAIHQYQPHDIPGVFTLVDNIGDVLTGESIVVATDYLSFAVKWGCAKADVFNGCDDPYVVIKTRLRFPKRKTWQTIKHVLWDYFRYPISELILYSQNNPCYPNTASSPLDIPVKPRQIENYPGPKIFIKDHHDML